MEINEQVAYFLHSELSHKSNDSYDRIIKEIRKLEELEKEGKRLDTADAKSSVDVIIQGFLYCEQIKNIMKRIPCDEYEYWKDKTRYRYSNWKRKYV